MRTPALVLALLFAVTPAVASSDYPEVVQKQLDLDAKPPCALCHRDERGGAHTAIKPFAKSLIQYGGLGKNPGSIRAALDAMAQRTDSDRDTVSDTDEAIEGRDPNVYDPYDGGVAPPALPDEPPLETGCSVSPQGDASAWMVLLGTTALSIVARRRRRISKTSRKQRESAPGRERPSGARTEKPP